MSNKRMERGSRPFEELTELLSRMDETADLAACRLASCPDGQAESVLDGVLAILGQRWKGDSAEFAARRSWLRAEILRRQLRVGRA